MSTQTYSQAYGYDRYGNRTQAANATLGLPALSSSDYDTTNNNNRFISSVASYDAAGNITTDSKFRSLTYTYDANGRQKSASNGTWTQTQLYDCAGQRVQTTVGSTTRTMVYDAFGQNVAEYSGTTLERENIYRSGALLTVYEAAVSAFRYVLTDLQGSARAMLNSTGAVLARHDYLPFGEEIASGIGLRTNGQGFDATDTNRQKYGLTDRDDTSGLDHTWWRKYESRSGRWTSPDPLRGTVADPQSFNAYNYAANDPVNFVDPTGLDPQDPPPITHTDPHTGEQVPVPGINAGIVTITAGFEGGTIGGSGLGMFGGDANQAAAVINRALLKQAAGQGINPQDRITAARNEFLRRLLANNGNNPCAKLFGGVKNAQKALKNVFVGPEMKANVGAVADKKGIAINPVGGFFDTSGSHTFQLGFNLREKTAEYVVLDNEQAAAFILAHEAGHVTGKLESDGNDPFGFKSIMNNKKIHEACFSDTPSFTGPQR